MIRFRRSDRKDEENQQHEKEYHSLRRYEGNLCSTIEPSFVLLRQHQQKEQHSEETECMNVALRRKKFRKVLPSGFLPILACTVTVSCVVPYFLALSLSSSSSSSQFPANYPHQEQQQQQERHQQDDDYNYKKSNASLLGIPAPPPFTFYVYDNLPYHITAQGVSDCIEERFQNESDCGWALHTCTETKATNQFYSGRRRNYNADVLLAHLFETYPYNSNNSTWFATRTRDPNNASVFVVPYPHDSHCKCFDVMPHCLGNEMATRIQQDVFAYLKYYNDNTNRPHLFLSSTDWLMAHPLIRRQGMHTTLGDLRNRACLEEEKTTTTKLVCSNFVIPYLNTNADYQPHALRSRGYQWWMEHPRTYSVAAVFGNTEKRRVFMDHIRDIFGGHMVGNRPIQTAFFESRDYEEEFPTERTWLELYQNSTFCIILSGDAPPQKRFYDAILSGCIPVVYAYYNDNNHHPKFPSWWKGSDPAVPPQQSIRTSYPFPRGLFPQMPWLGIDYHSFVAEINVTACRDGWNIDSSVQHQQQPPPENEQWIQEYSCTKSVLESILDNTTHLMELRQNLLRHAPLFAYPIQEKEDHNLNHHMYDDDFYPNAFSVLLNQLGHVLEFRRLREQQQQQQM